MLLDAFERARYGRKTMAQLMNDAEELNMHGLDGRKPLIGHPGQAEQRRLEQWLFLASLRPIDQSDFGPLFAKKYTDEASRFYSNIIAHRYLPKMKQMGLGTTEIDLKDFYDASIRHALRTPAASERDNKVPIRHPMIAQTSRIYKMDFNALAKSDDSYYNSIHKQASKTPPQRPTKPPRMQTK